MLVEAQQLRSQRQFRNHRDHRVAGARGQAGADQFGVEYTDDLDALLARDDLDGVTVTTATNVHRDVMVKAANAGKHIYAEKVLAPTVAEAEEIIAAADANNVKLVVS